MSRADQGPADVFIATVTTQKLLVTVRLAVRYHTLGKTSMTINAREMPRVYSQLWMTRMEKIEW